MKESILLVMKESILIGDEGVNIIGDEGVNIIGDEGVNIIGDEGVNIIGDEGVNIIGLQSAVFDVNHIYKPRYSLKLCSTLYACSKEARHKSGSQISVFVPDQHNYARWTGVHIHDHVTNNMSRPV